MGSQITNLFLNEIPTKVFLDLLNSSNKNKTMRANSLGVAHSTYYEIIKICRNAALLTIEKKGRDCFLHLTQKGRAVANGLILLKEQIERGSKKDGKI